MGLITSSDLPGHKLQHERICTALDRCHEFPDLDFKESAPWQQLKLKLIKSIIGMGNLQDGGIVIIGVSQRDDVWQLDGISDEHLNTFDSDDVADQIRGYISPYVRFLLLKTTYQVIQASTKKTFLAIVVEEFVDTPLVCKKDASAPSNPKDLILQKGCVYIRPFSGKPRTTKVTTAEEMHDLLELAAEKRARRILEVSQRVGLVPSESSRELFDKEIQNIETQSPVFEAPHWYVNFRPEFYEPEKIASLSDCFHLIEQSRVNRAFSYPHKVYDSSMRRQGNNWVGAWNDLVGYDYWRFYQSSQFINAFSLINDGNEKVDSWFSKLMSQRANVIPPSGYLDIKRLALNAFQIFEFAARLSTKEIYGGSLTLHIKLVQVNDFALIDTDYPFHLLQVCKASERELRYSCVLPTDDLIANPNQHAINAACHLAERFGLLDVSPAYFQKLHRDLFHRYY